MKILLCKFSLHVLISIKMYLNRVKEVFLIFKKDFFQLDICVKVPFKETWFGYNGWRLRVLSSWAHGWSMGPGVRRSRILLAPSQHNRVVKHRTSHSQLSKIKETLKSKCFCKVDSFQRVLRVDIQFITTINLYKCYVQIFIKWSI